MAKKQRPASAKNRPRTGLGKGLGALIGETSLPASGKDRSSRTAMPPLEEEKPSLARETGDRVFSMAISAIRPSPWQPRQDFDEESLKELTDSIRSHGILQPLLCRRLENGDIELVAGERRLRAAGNAGLKQAPVILVEASDHDAAEMALIENLQREDLNVIEEAEGYRILAKRFQMTQQEVAERVGKARTSITNALRLLELPDEVKHLISEGHLSSGHAKVLLAMSEETEQIKLARRCVAEDLSVRTLETLLRRRLREGNRVRPSPTPDIPDNHLNLLADRLRNFFGTRVRLSATHTLANGKRGTGKIEIDFYDNDDLDRILELLGVKVEEG